MNHQLHVPRRALAEIAEIASGVTKGRRLSAPGISVPYLRVANVQAGHLRLDEIKEIETTAEELQRYRLKEGDVLMTEGGDPDKLGRGALWEGAIDPCIHQNHVFRVRLDTAVVEPRYFVRFLATPSAVAFFLRAAKQTTGIATINKTQLSALPVPLPPLPEQRRIADILDKADAIRRKRKEAIALTEELLRSAFLDMFGDPVTNPKGWPVKALGELVEIRGGGTPSRARADFFAGNIPWATAKDFRSDVLTDTEEHVSEAALAESASKLVPRGSILIVVKSKILMRRLPVAVAGVPLCFNQDVKALILREVHDGPYLATHIRLAQRQLLELARGVNTEGLTLAHLRGHMVMLPPVSVVRAFAALETKVRSSLTKAIAGTDAADDLFNSLVARAFSGALEPSR